MARTPHCTCNDCTYCKRAAAGRKGGQTRARQFTHESQAYARSHVKRESLRRAGSRGLHAMADKHWNGDIGAALRRLAELGRMATDPFPANGVWQYPKRQDQPW